MEEALHGGSGGAEFPMDHLLYRLRVKTPTEGL
jgi:hypothetical protein